MSLSPAEIKRKRKESLLEQLIPEALNALGDKRLHVLNILEVNCARGLSDAKVYIDPKEYTQKEQNEFHRLLRAARPVIENHCLKEQGWYRCPTLAFIFDEHNKQVQHMEDLFKKISKRKPLEEEPSDES